MNLQSVKSVTPVVLVPEELKLSELVFIAGKTTKIIFKKIGKKEKKRKKLERSL